MQSVITFIGLGTDGINAVPTINGKGNCYNGRFASVRTGSARPYKSDLRSLIFGRAESPPLQIYI